MEIINPDGGILISELVFGLAFLLALALPLLALIDLVHRRFQGTDKIIWTVIVLIFPIMGPLLYLSLGRTNHENVI
jgi:uncharacterized membrane protein YhaH (DUF805 family)